MARERIDDVADAKRVGQEHREELVAYMVPEVTPIGDERHAVAGVGMDGIEVDFVTLRQTERQLADLHDQLVDHIKRADQLTEPLEDGTSPVAGPMRTLFRTRADTTGGVQATLYGYLREITSIRLAIVQTLETYGSVEQTTVSRLQRQMSQLEEISL